MPLAIDAKDRIRFNLREISLGGRPAMITIGVFTPRQFKETNETRTRLDLHPLDLNEILFLGRHLYESRKRDGYTIDDMIAQIDSAMASAAEVTINKFVSCLQNPVGRPDGYGNIVHDRAVFEMTARKPRAELYSVMPKGDVKKPGK